MLCLQMWRKRSKRKDKNAETGPPPLPVRRVVKKPIVPRVPATSRGASSSKMRHIERLLKEKHSRQRMR